MAIDADAQSCPSIAEDKAKTPHRLASMVYHDAKINSDDPKKDLFPQKLELMLGTHHNKSPAHPDTVPCVISPNSPKSAKTYSLTTHLRV